MTTSDLIALLRACAGDHVLDEFIQEAADQLDAAEEQFQDDVEEIKRLEAELEEMQGVVDAANADADEAHNSAHEKARDQLAAYLASIGVPAHPVTTAGYSPELRALIEAIYG